MLKRVVDLAVFVENSVQVLAAIPIPVSVTENVTMSGGPCRAETLISPRSVNFTALLRKFNKICETFPSSVSNAGCKPGSRTRAKLWRRRSSAGLSRRRLSNSVAQEERVDPDRRLSRFHPG